MPTELMQAAMTAINNRTKINSIDRKSKGKAPIPPLHYDNDEPIDNVDHANVKSECDVPPAIAKKIQSDHGKCHAKVVHHF